jgi:hypothetical protein
MLKFRLRKNNLEVGTGNKIFNRKNKEDILCHGCFTAQKQMHGYAYVVKEISASDDSVHSRTNNHHVTSGMFL